MPAGRASSKRGRSNSSSAIGWISTSDAFLFGVGVLFLFSANLNTAVQESEEKRTQLQNENTALTQDLAAANSKVYTLATQLAESQQQLAEVGTQLKKLQNDLRSLEDLNRTLAEQVRQLREGDDELRLQVAKLQSQIEGQLQQIASLNNLVEYLKKLGRERIDGLKSQLEVALAELDCLQLAYEGERDCYEETLAHYQNTKAELEIALATLSQEKRFRIELIGLKGEFSKVAILLDRSRSMKDGGRWADAKSVMKTWIDYLRMDECVLIVFSTEASAYPTNGELLLLTGTQGKTNREGLAEYLDSVEPLGGTNTLDALKLAYDYEDIDAIVLFTDGAPNDGRSAVFDPEEVEKIQKLITKRPDIPINAVGLGDYFHPELSGFLLDLAKRTKGTFLGR